MKMLTLQDIKRRGAKAISDDEVSYLIVNSRPKAAIVPYDEYESLIELLEDNEDRKDIEARKADKLIDAKDVYKKLGI
jgi:prevent-host-death family protein